MTIMELAERQEQALAEARTTLTEISADNVTEERASELETKHDNAMAEYDRLGKRLEQVRALEQAEQRLNAPDPNRPTGRSIRPGGASLENVTTLTPEMRMADWVSQNGHTEPAERGLSVGRYLRSMVVGAETEAERRALVEGTDSSGGYTVPITLSASLVDLMRSKTVAVRAGARTVPLTSDVNDVAVLASDPVPAWRGEGKLVTESEPTFSRIRFEPRSLAVLTKVSRELLEDSLNLETALPEIIAAAMAAELDRVVLFGSGAEHEPRGLINTPGINTIDHNAALTNYVPMLRARTAIQSRNVDGISGFIMNPRDEGALLELTDANGQPLNPPTAVADTPWYSTTAVPTDGSDSFNESQIIGGQFRHLLLGVRSSIRIEVLRERFAETMEYAFLAHLRADVAVEQPGAFTVINGVQPAE